MKDLLYVSSYSLGGAFLFGGVALIYIISKWFWKRKNERGEEVYQKVLEYPKSYYGYPVLGMLLTVLWLVIIVPDFDEFLVIVKSRELLFETYFPPGVGIVSLYLMAYLHFQKIFYSDYTVKICRIFHKTRVIRWSEVRGIDIFYYHGWNLNKEKCKITLFLQKGCVTLHIKDIKSDGFRDFYKALMNVVKKYGIELNPNIAPDLEHKILVKKVMKFMGPVISIGLLVILYITGRKAESEERFIEGCVRLFILICLTLGVYFVAGRNRKKDKKIVQNFRGQSEEPVFIYRASAGARGGIFGLLLFLWFIVIGAGLLPAAMGDWENGKDAALTFEMIGIPCMIIYTVFMMQAFPGLWTDIYFNREKIMIKRWWRKSIIHWDEIGEVSVAKRKMLFFDRHGKKLFTLVKNFDGYDAFRQMYEHSHGRIPELNNK